VVSINTLLFTITTRHAGEVVSINTLLFTITTRHAGEVVNIYSSQLRKIVGSTFVMLDLPRLWYGSLSGSISLNHLSIFYNISCYNSLVLLTFVSRFSCRNTYIYTLRYETIVKIQRGNPRFDSIFYNNASVLKKTFACPRLKNEFPSFLSSLYVRTTNIYWRNSSLFSTTHPTFLHSCPFRRSAEHILFRAISLVGKIFGTSLACSSLCTANPFRIERPIKPGADPGFQVRGGALKKIAPSGGRREHFWGILCEK
jgi:hypothetical protein